MGPAFGLMYVLFRRVVGSTVVWAAVCVCGQLRLIARTVAVVMNRVQ